MPRRRQPVDHAGAEAMSAPEVITKEQVDAASIKAADAIRRKSPDAQALVFEANRLWTIWHFQQESDCKG